MGSSAGLSCELQTWTPCVAPTPGGSEPCKRRVPDGAAFRRANLDQHQELGVPILRADQDHAVALGGRILESEDRLGPELQRALSAPCHTLLPRGDITFSPRFTPQTNYACLFLSDRCGITLSQADRSSADKNEAIAPHLLEAVCEATAGAGLGAKCVLSAATPTSRPNSPAPFTRKPILSSRRR
jgi:hypothetical protein